jgi:hypothetical protein
MACSSKIRDAIGFGLASEWKCTDPIAGSNARASDKREAKIWKKFLFMEAKRPDSLTTIVCGKRRSRNRL